MLPGCASPFKRAIWKPLSVVALAVVLLASSANGQLPELVFTDGFEIKLGPLAILDLKPSIGAEGSSIRIHGIGFSEIPGDNAVKFNGIVTPVSSATLNELKVNVPVGATTGPVSVTVGGDTAMSPTDFIVLQVPIIDSIWPRAALPGTAVPGFEVTGASLVAVNIEFQPVSQPPLLPVNSLVLAPDGNSATMDVTVQPASAGEYVVVATNLAGPSDTVAADANRFTVFANGDGDADNDGLTDGQEITLGTDPFDADTDDDGWPDEAEVTGHGDPLDKDIGPFFPVVASRPRIKVIFYELGEEPADNTIVVSRPEIEITRLEVGTEPADNTIVASPPEITVEREQL